MHLHRLPGWPGAREAQQGLGRESSLVWDTMHSLGRRIRVALEFGGVQSPRRWVCSRKSHQRSTGSRQGPRGWGGGRGLAGPPHGERRGMEVKPHHPAAVTLVSATTTSSCHCRNPPTGSLIPLCPL